MNLSDRQALVIELVVAQVAVLAALRDGAGDDTVAYVKAARAVVAHHVDVPVDAELICHMAGMAMTGGLAGAWDCGHPLPPPSPQGRTPSDALV